MPSPRKPIGTGMRPPLERGNDLARTQTLAQSGRIDEAIAATDRHVGQGSRDAEFLRIRAMLEQTAGRRVLAVAFAARAEAVESHPDSLMILARADVGAGETDLPILDVRYEEVVTDPGTQFPRFIGFLGLDWDEGCTRFHESRRTVRTLSYDQVNRPLYSSSVERWRNYERHLKGVACPGSP